MAWRDQTQTLTPSPRPYSCQGGLGWHWNVNLEHARWTGANLMHCLRHTTLALKHFQITYETLKDIGLKKKQATANHVSPAVATESQRAAAGALPKLTNEGCQHNSMRHNQAKMEWREHTWLAQSATAHYVSPAMATESQRAR